MEENKLEKKYGLITAICMVVGIVIGSGVFFKAKNVLVNTGGDMPLGILAWVIGGVVMLVCGYTFSTLATRYEKVNGLVDYSEAIVGKKYAYFISWFCTNLYYPGMTSALAWVSARYTLAIFKGDGEWAMTSPLCLALAGFYLCFSYTINALSPKLAGKWQVSSTFIKMVPLVLMAVIGIIVGLKNGVTLDAFKTWGASAATEGGTFNALLKSVVATAFAYEGWIIATSINAELKNSKKNLPIALVGGCAVIMVIYIAYYIGIAGAVDTKTLMTDGANAAFDALFGKVGGTVIGVFIAVSCLGTLNGLMVASTRGMYATAVRGQGPKPEVFSELSKGTNMPTNSSVYGLFICAAWLFYFFGANLCNPILFGPFSFDSSELPIITLYALYIPMFIIYIVKTHKESFFKNVLMPILAIICSGFMVFAAIYSHGYTPYVTAKAEGKFSCPVLFYLIIFAVIMIIGAVFINGGKKKKAVTKTKEKTEQKKHPF